MVIAFVVTITWAIGPPGMAALVLPATGRYGVDRGSQRNATGRAGGGLP